MAFGGGARGWDDARRFAPVFDDTTRQTVPCDTVLLAVGQSPVTDFLPDGGADIQMVRPGWPRVDSATLMTTAEGVFVAGDLAHGTRLLIDAVASGKAAARAVYAYVTGRPLHADALTAYLTLPAYRRERGYEAIRRGPVPVRDPQERGGNPHVLVEVGYGRGGAGGGG